MATDVSSFKDAYKTAIKADFPTVAELVVGTHAIPFRAVSTQLRYGTNPHQPFGAYYPINGALSVGNLEMLKGGKDGLSLTNLQDMSQAVNILKYFAHQDANVAMKHLNPCGFKARTRVDETNSGLYKSSRDCDARSHFGAVVGFNYPVDVDSAEAIMETFVECVIAPGYGDGALEVLRRNEGTKKLNNAIRVAQVKNMYAAPKFVGDDVHGFFNLRTLVDGTLTLEVPYLTRIRSAADFVTDPMVVDKDGKQHIAQVKLPSELQDDCVTSWYLNINTRSNGVVFVRDGMALAVGTGQQERIGAVEQAIAKAKQKGHSLEGSVMSSDAFFPNRDCIDAAAKEGVRAIVWPAGSMNDAGIIDAANEHGIALAATLERCFLHI